MTLRQFVELLRYDLNDTVSVNTFFSELDLVRFLLRSLYDVVIVLKNCKRVQFFSDMEFVDTYPLNRDFISGHVLVDCKTGQEFSYNDLTRVSLVNTRIGHGLMRDNVKAFQVDENRRVLISSHVPREASPEYAISAMTGNSIDLVGTVNQVVPFYAVHATNGERYFVRVTHSEPITGGVRIFFSERFDTLLDDVYVFPAVGHVREIAYVFEYFYIINQADYVTEGLMELLADRTVIPTTLAANANAGDALFAAGYGVQDVTAVSAAPPTITIAGTFSRFRPVVPTVVSGAVFLWNTTFPITNEIMNIVTQFAKYYAMLKIGDQRAPNQLGIAQSLLSAEERRQVSERVHLLNRSVELRRRRTAYEG